MPTAAALLPSKQPRWRRRKPMVLLLVLLLHLVLLGSLPAGAAGGAAAAFTPAPPLGRRRSGSAPTGAGGVGGALGAAASSPSSSSSPPPPRPPPPPPPPPAPAPPTPPPARPLLLYNSLTRSKGPFAPVDPACVTMYTCGPTVYDSAHVGNFRAFLTYDLLKRVLLYLGYAVLHVCNLTDVDDKIIQRANERRVKSIAEITGPCTAQFFDDLRLLNVVPATRYPRATEHISDMTDMILRLRDNGLAYETGDGSWYFDTQKQPGYGTRLVQLNRDEMRAGAQAGNDGSDSDSDSDGEPEKRHPADFCLWKAFKEGFDRDDASWSRPPEIGRGRPGWHLECSAMVRRYLGDRTLDLHGGGIDLKFPHHENEIAQSEGCSGGGSPFCACWFHNGFVNVGEGEKMSKSLGNFVTLRQACPTPRSVRAYRYLVVASQYRNPLSFTDQALRGAESALARIDRVRSQIRQALELAGDEVEDAGETAGGGAPAGGAVIRALERFESAIRDDLAMPRAAAALFGLVKRAEEILRPAALASSGAAPGGVRADALAGADARELRSIQRAMERMDSVFGIFYDPEFGGGSGGGAASSAAGGGGGGDDNIPAQVLDLAARRAEAKAAKDWELADELRSRIAGLGYQIKDVKGGEPVITRAGAAGR